MNPPRLRLEGIAGLSRNEVFFIPRGATVLVGRSRACEICLRKMGGYLKASPRTRDRSAFSTVSRQHLRISYLSPEKVSIEDLSSNGTRVDGERITRVVIEDLPFSAHELLLGAEERFRVGLEGIDYGGAKAPEAEPAVPVGHEVSLSEQTAADDEGFRPIDAPFPNGGEDGPPPRDAPEEREQDAERAMDAPAGRTPAGDPGRAAGMPVGERGLPGGAGPEEPVAVDFLGAGGTEDSALPLPVEEPEGPRYETDDDDIKPPPPGWADQRPAGKRAQSTDEETDVDPDEGRSESEQVSISHGRIGGKTTGSVPGPVPRQEPENDGENPGRKGPDEPASPAVPGTPAPRRRGSPFG